MVQQLHLFGRRVHLDPIHDQLIGVQIHHQLVKGQLFLHRAVGIGAAHDRMDPGQQLLHLKGFGHIVVRSHLQAVDLIVGLALRG